MNLGELIADMSSHRVMTLALYWLIVALYFPLVWKSVSAIRRRATKISSAQWMLLVNAAILFMMSMAEATYTLFSLLAMTQGGPMDPLQLLALRNEAYHILTLMGVSIFHLVTFAILFSTHALVCNRH